MDIPYTVKNRPDTGLYNGKLGVWLFLASEVMLFGGLFSAYIFLRTGVDDWPAGTEYLDVPLATLNTLFLISSSVTMVMSWASLKLNDFKKYKLYTLITLLFAFGFLVIKYFEYSAKFAHNPPYLPSTNNFLGIYFTMTGLHVLHIIGGILVIGYFYGPGSKMWNSDPERFTNRIEIVGLIGIL
jgi:cytochrome c oxidase subunit 3